MELSISNFGYGQGARVHSATINITPLMLFTGLAPGQDDLADLILELGNLGSGCAPSGSANNPVARLYHSGAKRQSNTSAVLRDPSYPGGQLDLLSSSAVDAVYTDDRSALHKDWAVLRHPWAQEPPDRQLLGAASVVAEANRGNGVIVISHDELLFEGINLHILKHMVGTLTGVEPEAGAINPRDVSCYLFEDGEFGVDVAPVRFMDGTEKEHPGTKYGYQLDYQVSANNNLYDEMLALAEERERIEGPAKENRPVYGR